MAVSLHGKLVLVLPNLISLALMMIKQDGAQKLGQ